ncbi:MAG: hypothetical protein ACRCTJ_01385 [Brevinema sp.]
MKMLLLIMLLLKNTVSFSSMTDLEKSELIFELKKGDDKFLKKYASRKHAAPLQKLENGQIYVKKYLSGESLRQPFTFINNGKTFLYENKFGVRFVNDEEVLLSLDEIKSMPNAQCFGFYDLMKKSYYATNYQQIQKLYKEFSGDDLSYYYIIVKNHYYTIFDAMKDRIKINTREVFTEQERDSIAERFFHIAYSTEEKKRIAYLNMILSQILSDYYEGHPYLTVPNNSQIRFTLSGKIGSSEEYKCLDGLEE